MVAAAGGGDALGRVVGDEDVVEDLGEPLSPSSRPKPRTVTPSVPSGTRKYVSPLVAFGLAVGAEQTEQVRAEGARVVQVFWPDGSHPPPRVVAHRPGRDPGQVGIRRSVRTSPGTTGPQPPTSAGVVVLLGGRPELEDGRGEQEDAVLGDPLGAPAR